MVEVVRLHKKWLVRRVYVSKDPVILGSFHRQACAFEAGKAVARDSKAEFVGKNRRGEIREKNSYGSDPRSVRG
jgi:hypothetical protein